MRTLKILAAALFAVLAYACTKDGRASGDEEGAAAENVVRTVSSAEELKAWGDLRAGETTVWKDGEYKDAKIEVYGSGTRENPAVLRAETPGGVVLTGDPQILIHGKYITVSDFRMESLSSTSKNYRVRFLDTSSNCTLKDCLIDGSEVVPDADLKVKWVGLQGSCNRVTQCSFLNMRSYGVLLEIFPTPEPCRHVVDRNYFTRPYSYLDASGSPLNGQEVIRIGTSATDTCTAACTVRENHFYNCVGEQAEVISNKSWGNTYEGNLLEHCYGTLCLRQGGRCTVSGNYFLGTGAGTGDRHIGGVRVTGQDQVVQGNTFVDLSGDGYNSALCLMKGDADAISAAYAPVVNAKILDNLFYECKYAFYINYGPSTATVAPSGVEVSGNTLICSNGSWYSIYVRDAMDESGITWTDNKFWGGTQKCTKKVATVPQKPGYESWTESVVAIRRNAGVSWE